MKTSLLTLVLSCFFLNLTQAQDTEYPLFEKHIYKTETAPLYYRLLKPKNLDTSQTYPLVLFLHGAGERGTDNEITLNHIDKLFLNEENREKYPCYVLVPQCPKEKRWVEVHWGLDSHSQPEEPSFAMQATSDLLKEIIQAHPIDTQKLYITGLSMGGYGTWDMISRYPDLFAAAAPICGGGDEAQASKITQIPIWAFHGDRDRVVKVERTRNMIRAIEAEGGKSKYTEYEGVGHGSWIPAYKEKQFLEWMFGQVKE